MQVDKSIKQIEEFVVNKESTNNIFHTTKTNSQLFPQYTFDYTQDWSLEEDMARDSEHITLTNEASKLEILISETNHITQCVLEGESEFGYSLKDFEYEEISINGENFYVLRNEINSYIFCGKCIDESTKLCTATKYGYISFATLNKGDYSEVLDILKTFNN